jgi:endonuclease YncB( thermonuclease family)
MGVRFLGLCRLRFLLVLLTLVGSAAADTLAGRVVRVIDGDTLVLLASGRAEERVRLSGIG